MKKLLLIVIAVVFGSIFSLNAQNNLKNADVEYTANTRGFYQKIKLKGQMLSFTNDRNDTLMQNETKISSKDFLYLNTEFKKIKLVGISKLKPPTSKRQYDGAAIADLKIVYSEKTYQTQSFDNGYPNIKIKKFVDKLISLVKK